MVTIDHLRALHNPRYGGSLPQPLEGSTRHHPVPFDYFADTIAHRTRKVLGDKYDIAETHLALNKKQDALFGLYVLEEKAEWWGRDDVADDHRSKVIAFRNSIVQEMSNQVAFAKRVFICENLIMSADGDAIWVLKKNTTNVLSHLGYDIEMALNTAEGQWEVIDEDVELFQSVPLKRDRMAELTGLAQYRDILTSTQANEVYRQIDNPTDEVFRGDTFWEYSNHLTEAVKIGSNVNTFTAHSGVHAFAKEQAMASRPRFFPVAA